MDFTLQFGINLLETQRPVNFTAWRGIAVNAHVNGASMCEYVGPGLRFGYVTMSASLTYWFATVNNHLLPADPHVLWSQVAAIARFTRCLGQALQLDNPF